MAGSWSGALFYSIGNFVPNRKTHRGVRSALSCYKYSSFTKKNDNDRMFLDVFQHQYGIRYHYRFGIGYIKSERTGEEAFMANIFQLLLAQIYPRKNRLAPSQESTRVHAKNEVHGQERIQKRVEKEDFLLSQIDEFREKAKQLQLLLASKESKVQELQSIVNEREDKAQELENILTERQEEADKIVTEFSRTVDGLAGRITSKMAEIEVSISHQVADVKKASEEQLDSNRRLNEEQIAANRKLSEEQLATNKQFLEEQAIANKKLSEGQMAEVKALLESATEQLESIKTDLSEKVHSENVKCYRNIQDLFNEFDSKIEKMDDMEKGVGFVKGYVKCLSWFSILNFVVLIGFILYSIGVFNF